MTVQTPAEPTPTVLTMHDAAKRQVVRTNTTLIAVLAPLLALAQLPAAISSRNPLPALAFLCFAVLLVPTTYVLARRMVDRSRVVLDAGTYTVHGLGRTRRFTIEDAARVVTIDRMAFGAAGPTHHLIVVGPTKRLLLLVGQMWDREQLSALALDLAGRGVPLTPIHEQVTPRQLRAHDPRLVPAWQAHPVATGLLIGLGVLMIVIAVFVAVVATMI